jgi:arylsulfatase A-like enzyme
VGFGASSAFGGPCRTPATERLAAGGLKLTRFRTTALCAPSRAALLTGRNHHSVGMGSVPDLATSAPGNNSVRPRTAAPLAEILRLNGYSTAQFGKCHEVPMWQTSPAGPFDLWPTGSGFEYFYGFIGGGTNQWYPALYEGTTPIDPPKRPENGDHLTQDLTNRAITWIRQQKALVPGKPFFVYFAPGATHAPHHVPAEWIERNRGRFDAGWDRLRAEVFARQKDLGVIPRDAVLTPRPAEIPAWDAMPAELQPVLARQMEVFAAYLEHTDHEVGRLLDAVAELGILDETHSLPWVAAQMPVFDDDTWELYDTTTDWTQARDLAAEQPGKLRELQRLFLIEAVKYGALPLDDRRAERFLAEIAGRPQLVTGHTQLPFGGWSLYLRDGQPCYCWVSPGATSGRPPRSRRDTGRSGSSSATPAPTRSAARPASPCMWTASRPEPGSWSAPRR